MVEDRCVHAAMRLTSIEFSFDPCNVYRDVPMGVGYPADARSVGDSHHYCRLTAHFIVLIVLCVVSVYAADARSVCDS